MGCQQDRFGEARNCSFFLIKVQENVELVRIFVLTFFSNDCRYWSQRMCMRCSMAMDTQELLHEEDMARWQDRWSEGPVEDHFLPTRWNWTNALCGKFKDEYTNFACRLNIFNTVFLKIPPMCLSSVIRDFKELALTTERRLLGWH